jgi:hypothetical protein
MNEMPAAPGSIQDEITQMKEPLEVSVAPQQVMEGAMMRMTTQGYFTASGPCESGWTRCLSLARSKRTPYLLLHL